jgi:RNA polymerase sigma-70 factor (ECF subfamily)
MDNRDSEARLVALLRVVAEGDAHPLQARESAFRELYERTSARMYGLALRVTGDRVSAEDVLQDAFLSIWRVADTYRDSLSPPLAWMGVVVRSRALDFLRRRAAQRADRTVEFEESVHDFADGDAATPPDLTASSEQAWALHECLRKLESRQREVLSLAYLRDLSHSELAQQLQLPVGTVKTWIRRGIDQLRGCMAHYA